MLQLCTAPPFVCVNCGHELSKGQLYREYGSRGFVGRHVRSPSTAASSQLLAGDQHTTHRLTECSSCGKPVDEYVQLDYNILFLDAILQKVSVYRHILLNCRLSSQHALKLAVIFGLCEAIHRWMALHGTVSGIACSTSGEVKPSKTYYELEMSFYITFVAVVLENLAFNALFYALFRLVGVARGAKTSSPGFVDVLFALIISNFGKLFLIPSLLYACELKTIVEHAITLFWAFSMVRCAQVKGHRFLGLGGAFALVGVAVGLNEGLQGIILRPAFDAFYRLFIADSSRSSSSFYPYKFYVNDTNQ